MAEAVFFLCSYEFAIKSENSPWCDLLDESDAQVRICWLGIQNIHFLWI